MLLYGDCNRLIVHFLAVQDACSVFCGHKILVIWAENGIYKNTKLVIFLLQLMSKAARQYFIIGSSKNTILFSLSYLVTTDTYLPTSPIHYFI